MEQWKPLFNLFLSSSPSPEPSSALDFLLLSQPPLTSSFLSLLLSPVPSRPALNFLQTLPHPLQSHILSFLSSSRLHFAPLLLRSLASHVVGSPVSSFWVRKAAQNLLDEMPDEFLSNDGFFDLPDWLREECNDKIYDTPSLSWLPFDNSSLPKKKTEPFLVPKKDEKFQSVSSVISSVPVPVPVHSSPLSNHEIERAMNLKREIGTVKSVQEAIALAKKIQELCTKTQNILEILSLIEPWEINDDMARILLSNLSFETEYEIPSKNLTLKSLVLSSIILPKLLLLQKQPSSILISTTLEFCKEHPVSAVDSLLIPLIFRNEGLNIPLCDLITKIIKDCLHPLQISFFIQKLLSNKRERKFICLNTHLEYISNELVWNESLFQLFYNMINRDKDIFLTPDSIEKLVLAIEESAPKFAKSLKFGNFMLCFVTKFGNKLKSHRDLLERSAGKTDTFVTKAILAKFHAILV